MNITFYQVAKLFPNNSTYLGKLIELHTEEVNTNMSNMSKVSLLLDNKYQDYNYIKVAKSENDYYYYFLESYDYYNEGKTRFNYKIDIVRTLQEKNEINHDVNVVQYSNVLDKMTPKQQIYFWKNQQTKLGSEQIEKYSPASIKYSPVTDVQDVWGNIKWLYVWLQPKQTASVDLGGNPYVYQYSFKKYIREKIINVLSTDLQIGKVWYDEAWNDPETGWNTYPVGQVYYCTDTNAYYRFVEEPAPNRGNIWSDMLFPRYKRYLKQIKDFNKKNYEYYFHEIPNVQMTNMPNSLYCMVLPLADILVEREWLLDDKRYYSWKTLNWGVDNIIPYLFDVNGDNNWNDWIVDIKLSLIPPFDMTDKDYEFRVDASTNMPKLSIPYTTPGRDFSPIKTLQYATTSTEEGVIKENDIFFPFLRYKPAHLMEIDSNFTLPVVNQENVVFKKYYLSIVEERRELDIPKLREDKATQLFYYEDLQPGRTNIAFGYAPKYNNRKMIIYYLLHSPSTIFLDRDTSLPIFTTNYQSYLANNKNFVQQAQLQRNSELAQNLIGAGSSAVGASLLSMGVPNYGASLAISQAAGRAANALISYDTQKKQFNWQVDNIKSAPGNYKAASATVSFMLSLNIYDLWIETYTSNTFDKELYMQLINDVGYNYFNFAFNLGEIINDSYIGSSDKKFLQAWLTGLTNNAQVNLPLINILNDQLREGVNIFL